MHDKICHNITKYCKNITKNITQLEFVIFSQKYDRIYEENIRRVLPFHIELRPYFFPQLYVVELRRRRGLPECTRHLSRLLHRRLVPTQADEEEPRPEALR